MPENIYICVLLDGEGKPTHCEAVKATSDDDADRLAAILRTARACADFQLWKNAQLIRKPGRDVPHPSVADS